MNKLSTKIATKSIFIVIEGGLQTLFASAIFSFVWVVIYFFFFHWWVTIDNEDLGPVVFLGVLSIFVLTKSYKYLVIPLKENKDRVKHQYEADRFQYELDGERKKRMFVNHPKKAKEFMDTVAKAVSEEHGLEQVLWDIKDYTSPVSVSPKRIYVTNEERLKLAENALDKMVQYSPDGLFLQMYGLNDNLKETMYGFPLTNLFERFTSADEPAQYVQVYKQNLQQQNKLFSEAEMYLQKEVGIIGAGVHGENRANEELNMYEGIWKNFANVRFEVNGQSVESDNIIVSTKGVFTLEVKNYSPNGKYGIRIAKDGQWLKVFNNGDEEPMNNVTMQMNRHIAFKHMLLNDEYQKKYSESISLSLLPIFVIANDTIRLQNETDLPIIRISQVYHHIMSQPDVLTPEQVDRISKIIQENQLPPKTYEMLDYIPALENGFNSLKEQETRLNKLFPILLNYSNRASSELIEYEKTLPQKFV